MKFARRAVARKYDFSHSPYEFLYIVPTSPPAAAAAAAFEKPMHLVCKIRKIYTDTGKIFAV